MRGRVSVRRPVPCTCTGDGSRDNRVRYPSRMADQKPGEIDDLLREDRTFPPPAAFQQHAQVKDEQIYAEAQRDPDAFWARMAGELEWSRPWDTVLDWQPPHAKWFVGGQLN